MFAFNTVLWTLAWLGCYSTSTKHSSDAHKLDWLLDLDYYYAHNGSLTGDFRVLFNLFSMVYIFSICSSTTVWANTLTSQDPKTSPAMTPPLNLMMIVAEDSKFRSIRWCRCNPTPRSKDWINTEIQFWLQQLLVLN